MKNLLVVIGLVFACWCFMAEDSCDDSNPADKQMNAQQEAVTQQGAQAVPVPGISHFTEKRIVADLYKLRDKADLSTYSYVVDMQGRLWHVCDSMGYGVPYGVQFSNPEAHHYNGSMSYNIPQAEPNGLFMPPTAEGTWVICIDPRNKSKTAPMYIEPRVIVSQWPLNAAGDYQSK